MSDCHLPPVASGQEEQRERKEAGRFSVVKTTVCGQGLELHLVILEYIDTSTWNYRSNFRIGLSGEKNVACVLEKVLVLSQIYSYEVIKVIV